MSENLEIEKKYIIAHPDEQYLKSISECTYTNIEQIYLLSSENTSERIRKRGLNGNYKYYHTIKRRINDYIRKEDEREISEEEYIKLKKRLDPKLNAIYKTRYVIPYEGFVMEIDVFPFWDRQAYLEVELSDANINPPIPPYIKCICEVTCKDGYSNYALSQKIPEQIV